MEYRNVPTDSLIPYERNPRRNDQAVDAVAASIREFGFKVPIVVDRDNVVVAGHTRLKAAKKLGLETVPVIVADDLTPEQIKAFRLADNKTAELAEWDLDLLDLELGEIEMEMEPFGFEMDADADGEAVDDDFDPEPPKEPKAKRGDIYSLGRHRLMCGDSTDAENVKALVNGNRVDVCFTSPPYNVMAGFSANDAMSDPYMKTGGVYEKYDDNLSADDYAAFLTKSLYAALEVCDDVLFNIGYSKGALNGTAFFLGKNREKFGGAISWEKSNAFRPQFDVQHGVLTNVCEPIYFFNSEGRRKFSHPQWDKWMPNVVKTENAAENKHAKEHGATFPIALAAWIIENYTADSVLDIFGGTGTTLIAAEQKNRVCYMMELDPKYIDVIIDRWETFTGEKAQLISRRE